MLSDEDCELLCHRASVSPVDASNSMMEFAAGEVAEAELIEEVAVVRKTFTHIILSNSSKFSEW
jgi:hypothetical protein